MMGLFGSNLREDCLHCLYPNGFRVKGLSMGEYDEL